MGIVREGCDLSVDCRYLLLLLENDLQRSQMFFRLVALMHMCKHNLLSREHICFSFSFNCRWPFLLATQSLLAVVF